MSPKLTTNSTKYQKDKMFKEAKILYGGEKSYEPEYVIAIELEGVNYKINIYEGDSPDEVINTFFEDKSKYNIPH